MSTIVYGQHVDPSCGFDSTLLPQNFENPNDRDADCTSLFNAFLSNHLEDIVPLNATRTVKIKINVIFMQREDGSGNYSLSNDKHVKFWNDIFVDINQRFLNMAEESCDCSTSPTHFDNIHIEFVPNYVEVRDEEHWNHQNDTEPNTFDSYSKVFLNECHELASKESEYKPGIDIICTNNKTIYDNYMEHDVPLWEILDQPGMTQTYLYMESPVWYSSSASTLDLNHQAIWHAPTAYYQYLVTEGHQGGTQEEWYVKERAAFVAGSIMHETGHMFFFGLGHKDNSCLKNVMVSGGSSIRTSFTGCQAREIYRSLMTSYIRKYVICEDVLEHDIVVDPDEEWKNNMRIYSNVVVRSGSTLKISCELYLQPKASISVEQGARLVLGTNAILSNGGVCNDEDKDNYWKGINVEGNNNIPHRNEYANESYTLEAGDHGIVMLLDGSTLENARTGISCKSKTFPDNGDLWGGYVKAKGVSFLNNNRSVEFMLSNHKNFSDFDGCLFDQGWVGLSSWASNGIKIQNSEFNDLKWAIYSENAGLYVRRNSFNRNEGGGYQWLIRPS